MGGWAGVHFGSPPEDRFSTQVSDCIRCYQSGQFASCQGGFGGLVHKCLEGEDAISGFLFRLES